VLLHQGVLTTSAARTYPLEEIGTAATQAETKGRQGKVLLVPRQHQQEQKANPREGLGETRR
jgi:hypothetical protein